MKSVAFVQLCRSGDVVLALPMMLEKHRQGYRVFCVVHRDFAGILDAVSYVTPVVFAGLHRDIPGAVRLAKTCADEVIVTQAGPIGIDLQTSTVTELDSGRVIPARNFVQRLWQKGGEWDRFHELPLVFDRRDREREARLISAIAPGPDETRPLVAYSLQGYCSYFGESSKLSRWIMETLPERFRLLDLTYDPVLDRGHKLARITDLIPFIELADVLITTNSLPLHVAYAFDTPTISLEPDGTPDGPGDPTYWRSEPRKHWIVRMGHGEAVTAEGQSRILSLLESHGHAIRQGAQRKSTVVP